jgi:hypothetical protein
VEAEAAPAPPPPVEEPRPVREAKPATYVPPTQRGRPLDVPLRRNQAVSIIQLKPFTFMQFVLLQSILYRVYIAIKPT